MKAQTMKFLMILILGSLISPTSIYAEAINGSKAPEIAKVDTNGEPRALSELQGHYVVLEWLNFGCPFVKKHYDSGNMQSLQKKFTDQGVIWISIVSSAKGKQGYYEPNELNGMIKVKNASPSFVLIDENGDVGRLYGAKTTPHMFIIDKNGIIIYQGAIDSIASFDQEDIKQAKNYVDDILSLALQGQEVEPLSTIPYGCSVKY